MICAIFILKGHNTVKACEFGGINVWHKALVSLLEFRKGDNLGEDNLSSTIDKF